MKLNLANAVKAYKKNANLRNTRLFEKEVGKFITKQIKLKTEEIETLKEKLEEGKEEKFEDLQEKMIQLDEERIKSTSSRQEYARYYVLKSVGDMDDNDTWEEDILEEIENKENEIKTLQKLEKILSEVEVKTEEE